MRETESSVQEKRKAVFESMPVPRAVFTLAVPTVITQLINIAYNMADTWFVGRTGNAAMVAALSVCMPIFVLMTAVANLFGIGGASVISRSLGAGRPARAAKAFAFCFYAGFVSAAAYALLVLLFRSRLIPVIGGAGEPAPYIYDYMLWTMVIGAVPTVGNVLCGHLVRSVGAAKEAGFGMSMGAVLNMVLDPLFMFVLFPPGHEVTGAALATLCSNTAALAYFLIYIRRHSGHPVFRLDPSELREREGIPGEVLAVGIPAAFATAFAMVSNIFANSLVSGYGSGAVAGLGVAKKINMLAFNTTMGLTQGVLPLIGYNYGSGDLKRMKEVIRFTGVMAMAFCLVCAVCFRSFSGVIVRAFIDEPESVRCGTIFLNLIAFASPLASVCYLINTVFQASGRRFSAFLLSVLRKGCLDIPGMFLFRSLFGMKGIAMATPAAEVLSSGLAVFLYIRYLKDLSGRKG